MYHVYTLYICYQDANEASMVAVEVTSTPESLKATDVSVSISIVANLTDKALNNSEVWSMIHL